MYQDDYNLPETVKSILEKSVGLSDLEIRALQFFENEQRGRRAATVQEFVKAVHCSKDTLYLQYKGKEGLRSSIQNSIETWVNKFVKINPGVIEIVPSVEEIEKHLILLSYFPHLFLQYVDSVDYFKRNPFATVLANNEIGSEQKERVLFCLGGMMATLRFHLRKMIMKRYNAKNNLVLAQIASANLKKVEQWINEKPLTAVGGTN
jgi:AcrR family transcriptional regulator